MENARLESLSAEGVPQQLAKTSDKESGCLNEEEEEDDEEEEKTEAEALKLSCHKCRELRELWICIICGYVGCGRYKFGHAEEHFKLSNHNFSIEVFTQRLDLNEYI
jgi:uncharacterized UBP type Zn finger protein